MTAVLILVVIVLLIAVVVLAWLWRRSGAELARERSQAKAKQKAAVKGSRSGHVGLIAEQLALLLPDFPYNLKDVQWVGGTIDFIVWDGLEEERDALNIIFLDVKTGQARLNDRQRRIQGAAEAGRVRFKVFRPETGIFQDAADLPVAEIPQLETVIIPPPSEPNGLATLPDGSLVIELPDDPT